MFCVMCGEPAEKGIVCNPHKPLWQAIHDFVSQHTDAPEGVLDALVKVPYAYDQESGQPIWRKLVEKVAAKEHDRWSHWMKYLALQGETKPDGSITISASMVERWKRQAETPYAALTEREQISDREWAAKLLPIIDTYIKTQQ